MALKEGHDGALPTPKPRTEHRFDIKPAVWIGCDRPAGLAEQGGRVREPSQSSPKLGSVTAALMKRGLNQIEATASHSCEQSRLTHTTGPSRLPSVWPA